jgi:long-chain fatty acid transport protein
MAHTPPVARRLQAFGIAGFLSLTVSSVFGGGFALIEQSVSSMGTAYAGAASASLDASHAYFNPASMSRLDDQASGGLHIVLPNTEFTGTGAIVNSGPFNGPFTDPGGNGGDAGTVGAIPHFAYVRKIDDKMNAGITINVPFGLKTDYDAGWAGRYHATESEVVSVNINPMLSFKVNDTTTLGIGVSALYANLKFQPTIDYGLLVGLPSGPGSLAGDGAAKIDIDDWGLGFNLGLLFEPSDKTRIGIAYRSEVDVELDGTNTITAVPGFVPAVALGAKSDTDLPATATLSITHDVDDRWTVMSDLLWTQWSNQDALVIRRSDGSTITIPLGWENTLRVAIGASYKHSDMLTLRAGVAFDETPTPSDSLRIASLPDEDRLWLTFGAGYKQSKNLTFDFGYAHLFIDDTRIDSDDAIISSTGPARHHLTGTYDASVDIISAQANWKFN